MYKVEMTFSAQKDLNEICEYIAFELKNITAVEDFLAKTEKCLDFLAERPYMYEACHNERLRIEGYHMAVIKNYVMIYRVDDKKQKVYVLRFFYGARDYEKLI